MELTEHTAQRLVAAKLYMDTHFHEPISLEGISEQAFFSRFHFHRLFCRVYRKTPHQYLTRKRLNKAQELLQQNLSITEVCTEVGFESTASFSLLFKKETGLPPQSYRQQWMVKKQQAKVQPRTFIPSCFLQNYLERKTSGTE
ncbi:helix-turn-helix transcriptional regulator [Pseudoflavitalea sp. G-6-1-2]|uniref:helix-turn-helix domain-containing protein n=1 Tax=Pseudoflavitalea sp. G-6-1-2 TaxID=2728841 RepID=UPI00146C7B9A|nr:AraC family transcriptional regulator [Pseudoflavitalea sp. G-6-1-2]NML23692.1 helix-turn-helix transcriptional regulator [Pseudoflavitalea sp. G-6-1-2]